MGLAYREGSDVCHALRGVRLGLRGPAFVGIVGPSGSGKSSLLYVLAGLKRATSGRVLALGQDLGRLGPSERCALRRRHFGFVFQQPLLIRFLTARENLLAGSLRVDRAARERASELLAALGLEGLGHRLPHQLSGGQRQRVAVGRALMNNPLVICADEPTAALDHATALELMALLHEYRRRHGALLLVVTHDETMLSGSDAVVRMWDGRVDQVQQGAASASG